MRGRAPAALVLATVVLTGCASLPEGRSAIDDVSVRNADAVPESDLTDQLATTASPKFLGLFRGVVYDYELLDLFALQRDLARIERIYRARGWYEAHARAGRIRATSDHHVKVEIIVEEGQPVLVESTEIAGLEGLPDETAKAVTRAVDRQLRRGRPFDEDKFHAAEADAKRALTDRGFAWAKVTSDAFVDVVHHEARVKLVVDRGPEARFGAITIVGRTEELPEDKLRRTIDIHEGEPYSTAAIDSAQRALLDLEIFSSVVVEPTLPDPPPDSHLVPLTVKLEPTRLRQLRLGGGVEFDQIKTDVHLRAGWEDHNFLGGLRDFTVDVTPGTVLYPTRIDNIVAPEHYLLEERFRVQLRQPGFIEPRTGGFIRQELNTYPLLVKVKPSPSDPVVGYLEVKAAAGLDRPFFKKLFVTVSYNDQVEYPFAYLKTLDPALRTLVISYPEINTTIDLRDDRIHPHSGLFVGNDLQIAGGPFFGDATDVKIQPELRTYVPIHRRVTFATRGSIGFLFAANYGDVARHPPTTLTDDTRAALVRDIETVYFRGFFSGGSSSNRGFPLRGVAPHGVVPFLNPATATQQVNAQCDPTQGTPDPATCSIPIGGFTLWELSNEVRFKVSGPFATAVFCDMSDVSPLVGNIRLDHPHLSCGLGARYDTPVGPVRVDMGYRVQPLQVLGYRSETEAARAEPTEGIQPTILGLPIAIAIGIGEAF